MTKKVSEILDGIEQSCDSAAVAFVEHLRTVAENGRRESQTQYLIDQAKNMIGWANRFIEDASPYISPRRTVQRQRARLEGETVRELTASREGHTYSSKACAVCGDLDGCHERQS